MPEMVRQGRHQVAEGEQRELARHPVLAHEVN
jgi:hypothetical protein